MDRDRAIEILREMALPEYGCVMDEHKAASAGAAALVRLHSIYQEMAEARRDGARLDWLDQFIECGCADFGFELDGGVYLRLDQPSTETIDIREVNDARAAIDAAMDAQKEAENG